MEVIYLATKLSTPERSQYSEMGQQMSGPDSSNGWSIRHESEGRGFEPTSGGDIFCLKNFDTFTRTSVRVSKMNAVASAVNISNVNFSLKKVWSFSGSHKCYPQGHLPLTSYDALTTPQHLYFMTQMPSICATSDCCCQESHLFEANIENRYQQTWIFHIFYHSINIDPVAMSELCTEIVYIQIILAFYFFKLQHWCHNLPMSPGACTSGSIRSYCDPERYFCLNTGSALFTLLGNFVYRLIYGTIWS